MKKLFIAIGIIGAFALGGFLAYGTYSGRAISIEKEVSAAVGMVGVTGAPEQMLTRDPVTGMACANGGKRPFAVMLSGDVVARPLSGIAQADIVIEMPVLTDSITRYMAAFSCEEPSEIGSIRSSRDDFLPFVKSLDAVYVHWGGSHFALDLLNAKVLDNIDALKNPFDVFYRKDDRPAPHNGFTSYERLKTTAEKLQYRADRKVSGYPHIPDVTTISVDQSIAIGYPAPYNVEFFYDHTTNTYLRSRGGQKEIDAGTGAQVAVKNVIVMTAATHQIDINYNDVKVEGEGRVTIYRNGEEKKGTWKRVKEAYAPARDDHFDNKYYFIDDKGSEIGLVPGKIWISIIQPDQKTELTFH